MKLRQLINEANSEYDLTPQELNNINKWLKSIGVKQSIPKWKIQVPEPQAYHSLFGVDLDSSKLLGDLAIAFEYIDVQIGIGRIYNNDIYLDINCKLKTKNNQSHNIRFEYLSKDSGKTFKVR